ncbi:MAG TPA: hypothetical protein DDW76_08070 [Cyanobacteria bacterium UBA11369]|nr:hypothetical protein [Cyanobacteria bacterium UBA11371]HBE33427.1 hypothetical protein [Cyanobacteria bacterium UBA11368]HBE48738.1 hypothetical protein [Cyanobacteria bacterium UBA11369]
MTQSLILEIQGNDQENAHKIEQLSGGEKHQHNLQEDQSIVYEYLLVIVKTNHPEEVLQEFRDIFIYCVKSRCSKALHAVYEIVVRNDELEFKNTLKRACYILINNWYATRQYQAIHKLLKIFSEYKINENTESPILKRREKWLLNFINSKDYQELNLFIAKSNVKKHWTNRFTSYLLVPQYVDLNNPVEQREAAKIFSQQLKEQFKFELAMYTARSQSAVVHNRRIKNPTGLGDEVLPLVKAIVLRRGVFSYTNLAHIFVKQNQNITYKDFKKNLIKYLIFDVENENFANALSKNLAEKLERIYENYDEESLDNSLICRTCNRIIEYLITNNRKEPSELFILLLTQGHALNLVVVLVKLILICKNVRSHLEACLAGAIQYYEKYPEEECQWLIKFLEILNVTLAIYTEDVEYNLVQMPNTKAAGKNSCLALDGYRIFSQFKEDKKAKNYNYWS